MNPNPVTAFKAARLRSRVADSPARGTGTPKRRIGSAALRPLIATAVIVAGAALALRGGEAAPDPRPPLGVQFSGAGLQVSAPQGWTRSEDPASIPGMTPAGPLVLIEELSKTQLVAELLPARSPTLLPEPLLRRLQAPLGAPETVSLGDRLGAYYYGDLALRDVPGRIDVYAVATSEGVATVACSGVPAPVSECATTAEHLTLTSAKPILPGPEAAFRSRLRGEIGAVNAIRERTRRELRVARTSASQSEAVRRLSAAYGAAAAALGPLAGPAASTSREIVGQLRANAATYARVAAGFEAQDQAAVARDRRVALSGEARLQVLLVEVHAAAADEVVGAVIGR